MSKLREQTIVEALSREKSQKDSTLPLTERQEVVEEFLKAGIPIHKIDTLRPLLEKNGYRLTGSSNLGQYISLIFKQETERVKQELSLPGSADGTRDVSVIFDRSTRQGEAIAIIVRFINDNWMISQRLAQIQWRIMSCRASRLSKIHGPLNCIPTAKDSVTFRGKNEKKHKTVFGDFKGVSIHERRKVAVILLNFVGSHFITWFSKGKSNEKTFSTGLSKARACRL